jgi:hypothetical protein
MLLREALKLRHPVIYFLAEGIDKGQPKSTAPVPSSRGGAIVFDWVQLTLMTLAQALVPISTNQHQQNLFTRITSSKPQRKLSYSHFVLKFYDYVKVLYDRYPSPSHS